VDVTRTPSPDHVEFDQLCAGVDEWQPMLAFSPARFGPEDERRPDEDTPLDGQILAGLVSPV